MFDSSPPLEQSQYQELKLNLESLQKIYPPNAVILVGDFLAAELSYFRSWQIPLFCISPSYTDAKNSSLNENQTLKFIPALLGDTEREQPYTFAVDATQSSTLSAEILASLYPDFRLLKQASQPCTRLQSLRQKAILPHLSVANWLVIASIPTLPVIGGLGEDLESIDVILTRAIHDDALASGFGASLSEVSQFLKEKNFTCLNQAAGTPLRFTVQLWIRNWKSVLNQRLIQATQESSLLQQCLNQAQETIESQLLPGLYPAKHDRPTYLTVLTGATLTALASQLIAVPLVKNCWLEQIDGASPEGFLIETTPTLEEDSSPYLSTSDFSLLMQALAYCKDKGIPVILLDYAELSDVRHYFPLLEYCDLVGTVEANRWAEAGESGLPPPTIQLQGAAFDPRMFNPAGRVKSKQQHLCWIDKNGSGTSPAASLIGLISQFQGHYYSDLVPEEYIPFAKPCPSQSEMARVYLQHQLLLQSSQTGVSALAIADQVLESLASGTPVLASLDLVPPLGLSESLLWARDAKEAHTFCEQLFSDSLIWARNSHIGYREAHSRHTLAHRFNELRTRLREDADPKPPLVSIIMASKRPFLNNRIAKNVADQTHLRIELVLSTQNWALSDIQQIRESLIERNGNIERIVILENDDHNLTLGARLNLAVAQSQGDFIAKMDDDDLYYPKYLQDMLLPFQFGDYGIVGKREMFIYLEGSNQTVLKNFGTAHQPRQFVAGASFVIKKGIFKQLGFADTNRGEDTALLQTAIRLGIGVYAADPFNFVVWRSQNVLEHTWQVEESFFLDNAKWIGQGLAHWAIEV